jgi:SpoIIAA-like
MKFRLNTELNMLFIRSDFVMTTAEVMRMNEEIQQSLTLPQHWSALIDLRDTTDFQIDTEGMQAIVAQDRELFDKYRFQKLAFVTDADLVFGMARMYQSLTATTPVELQVFRDMGEALKWVDIDPTHLEQAYAS